MQVKKPANFVDALSMFGASPALLEGKIKRIRLFQSINLQEASK